MMDPLTALSVASNVVQFIDFTSKVINLTWNVYRSKPDDITGEFYYLTRITEDFQRHNHELKASLQQHSSTDQSRLLAADIELLQICEDCESINKKLLAALNRLKSSKDTVWKSFLHALRTIWGEAEIVGLRQVLEGYRQQMTLRLLGALRDQVQDFQHRQAEDSKDMRSTVSKIHGMVKKFFDNILQEQDRAYAWQQYVLEAMQHEYQRNSSTYRSLSVAEMREKLDESDVTAFYAGLLNWLRFDELEHRQQEISSAHEKTFEWIFKPQTEEKWSEFPTWLQQEAEPLYWITGKPASGKSTLMKYIRAHPQTKQHLCKWAGGKTLITCSYYFWNSGSALQMSELGMARTLLYEAIRQAPELWCYLFQSKMEEFILFGNPWRNPITWHTLLQALRSLATNAGENYKVFFFIDGLDECSGQHTKLVDMIKSLVSLNVKTCVSSRLWPVFEDGFHQSPSLRLEDITYEDIKIYVVSRFAESRAFEQFQVLDPQSATNLIEDIVKKASGVFLWVKFVTDSLLGGLAEGERLEELHAHLEELPPDLEDLIWKILSRMDRFHLRRASELFQLYRACHTKMTLLMLSYTDEPDAQIAAKTPLGQPPAKQLHARAEMMRRRLYACCKGLLEPHIRRNLPLINTVVEYLHRTVKDYIERPEIWEKFLSLTDKDFNPYSRLCNERIIRLRTTDAPFFRLPTAGLSFWSIASSAIAYAYCADPDGSKNIQGPLLRELDKAGSYLVNTKEEDRLSYAEVVTQHRRFPTTWPGSRKGCGLNRTFLHLAIQCCLFDFVREAIDPSCGVGVVELSQGLLVALFQQRYRLDFRYVIPELPETFLISKKPAGIVFLLLSRGADPNMLLDKPLLSLRWNSKRQSSWEMFLQAVRSRKETLADPSEQPHYNASRTIENIDPGSGSWDHEDSRRTDYEVLLKPDSEFLASNPTYLTAVYSVILENEDTEWESTFTKLYLSVCHYDEAETAEIAKAMLDHGADPNLVKKEDGHAIWNLAQEKLRGQDQKVSSAFEQPSSSEDTVQDSVTVTTPERSRPVAQKKRRGLRALVNFTLG